MVMDTMQSHRGLGTFRAGDRVLYSKGERFATTRAPLFPIQDELERWLAATGQSEACASEASTATPTAESAIAREAPLRGTLQSAQDRVATSKERWQRCAVVDEQGWVKVRRHPSHRYRNAPEYIVPVHSAKGLLPSQRPLPLAQQAPSTPRPQTPPPPPEWIRKEVEENLHSWEDCMTRSAREELLAATSKVSRDEAELSVSSTSASAHRQRSRCGASGSEIRIGPDKFHPTVNRLLELGLSLDLAGRSKPRIRELRPLGSEEWGFDTTALREDAHKLGWPDEELIFFLQYGFMDYSGSTPPICSFSPQQQKAWRNLPVFKEQIRAEIKEGWIGPAQPHPPSIPFQVKPGSLEPKSGGRSRLVWNASWPAPGSLDSAVLLGNEWSPVAPNASTFLPTCLEFEWSAIETNNEIISIMADGARASGAPLLGRTFDLAKWFRQLGMATIELWKCIVYVDGGFREDRRMQMGRRSSAHSGQRTTFLLTALLQHAANKERWGTREPGETPSDREKAEQRALAGWLRGRQQIFGAASESAGYACAQDTLVYFSSFQDDITAIALGQRAAEDATKGVARVLQGKYGVPFSTKDEATKDFSAVFTSIGATYDLSDPTAVKCRPRGEKLAKYRDMLDTVRKAGPLIPLKEMQRFAGLHTFMARFLESGEFYCNSAYCCLRAAPHTKGDLRPVSKDLIKDAEQVLRLLNEGTLAPLTADPVFTHPGHQGFTADASGATGALAAGWGIHIHGTVASGKWSQGIKQALALNDISISPLELLAAAIALSIAAGSRNILPRQRQVILRSDSESACAVVNSMRADSSPMLEALRIFKEVKDGAGVGVRMQYIPTTENSIADKLSRGAVPQAMREARAFGPVREARPPGRLHQWYDRVLQAALQAERHTRQRPTTDSA